MPGLDREATSTTIPKKDAHQTSRCGVFHRRTSAPLKLKALTKKKKKPKARSSGPMRKNCLMHVSDSRTTKVGDPRLFMGQTLVPSIQKKKRRRSLIERRQHPAASLSRQARPWIGGKKPTYLRRPRDRKNRTAGRQIPVSRGGR